VLGRIGWEPNSVEMGFAAGDNSVAIARYTGGDMITSVSGDRPEQILPYIADAVLKQNTWQLIFTMGVGYGTLRPLLVLSPILAETLAKAGMGKSDVKRYLFEHARLPAREFERYVGEWTNHPIRDIGQEVRLGRMPKVFAQSDDPDRLVPIVFDPEDFMIAVAGDWLRTNAYTFAHNGNLGYPVGKKIVLPKDWTRLLATAPG
jgi:hypothetical protein